MVIGPAILGIISFISGAFEIEETQAQKDRAQKEIDGSLRMKLRKRRGVEEQALQEQIRCLFVPNSNNGRSHDLHHEQNRHGRD